MKKLFQGRNFAKKNMHLVFIFLNIYNLFYNNLNYINKLII